MKILLLIFFTVWISVATAQESQPCVTPNSERGFCIDVRSCKSILQLITKPRLTDADKTHLKRSQCGYANSSPLVCCPSLPAAGICGTSTSPRIFGGIKTKIDEYPWMALLKYSKPNNKTGFHCGGVLISDKYVLTASHCFNKNDISRGWKLIGVRLGEWDLSTEQDCEPNDDEDCAPPAQDFLIDQIIPHKAYISGTRNKLNDIALLRLHTSVNFTDFIKPICLPKTDLLRSMNFDGQNLVVAGWGKTEYGNFSNVKLKVGLKGVNLDTCKTIFKSINVSLESSQLCAGGEKDIDSCQGDSGGPLMTVDRSTGSPYWYVAGIVSFGLKCGLERWPGVYTKVGSYVDWIQTAIRP